MKDATDHAIVFLGGDISALATRDARTAVLQAYRNLANCHRWSYLTQRGRLVTSAPQTTGTIEYDHTGGTYERMVTLTGATWPTWVANGELVISDIAYEIAERKSSTVLTLSVNSNPGADVAALTTYTVQRSTYPLPIDCLAVDRMLNASLYDWIWFTHPREWLERQHHNQTFGQPRIFTIMGDPNYTGVMAARFYPPPDAAYQLDFLYHRMPRQLLVEDYSTGTATTSNGSTTVTGTGTSWSSKHAGCVLRLSDGSTDIPTGRVGSHPYHKERVVLSVTNATSLVVDQALDETLSGVKYILSDPVDLEEASMLTAFQRGIEAELATTKRMEERRDILAIYQQQLRMAMQADARSAEPRAGGMDSGLWRRLADMPAGPDLG